ncbi:MAG TPA: hypothetical protein VHH14_03825 [Solirubrobacterales bacterium]|nr:hypothetical protein [Solirubrobacterales bacterium]
MAVMAREAWTDGRLDDLAKRMDKGFDEVKGEVRDLRSEMNARFAAVDARFDAMQRTMIIGFASIVASVIGGIIATQL